MVHVDTESGPVGVLVDAVLDRAEAILRQRLTRDDQVRIRHEFSRQVETVQ
jgi:hypothetical protein